MIDYTYLFEILPTLSIFTVGYFLYKTLKNSSSESTHYKLLISINEKINIFKEMSEQQRQEQQEQRQRFDEHQIKSLKLIQDSLQKAQDGIRQQVTDALKLHSETLSTHIEKLTTETKEHLKEISGEVDKRLTVGFEKTNATFTDVVKRLAIIDQAQKKITELSGNVVSLQEILSDKKSRGAFGEVQLNNLIKNMIPEKNYSFQHTLSNTKRVDCMLFLPEPTGNLAIDAKFPLENYRTMTDDNIDESLRSEAKKQFKKIIRKHIQDIASKYIVPGETSDGAMMFIPAEAVFAEIHAHYPDLVEYAQQSRVWLVSPTTMMAILTTIRAVLKDAATRKQIHIIQDHLVALGRDFGRFEKRMSDLSKHINMAHKDVEDVHISSKKITSRFNKIEKVELHHDSLEPSILTGNEEMIDDA